MANSSCPITVKTETLIVSKFTGGNPEETIKTILAEKRSGQLTLHISQGAIGTVEWTEKGAGLKVGGNGELKVF